MAESRRAGKLAVILHADVAGSTTLVQQDERLAHERIQESFRRFGRTITRYQGRVRELRGDALLAEFERASDAVAAALAFQAEQSNHNAGLGDPIRPAIRAGIAMGEVILADRTVTGAGVVLAQRMEQLAEPGRVCITGAVHESLPQRMPFDQESLGDQEVRGFDEPVRVYAVRLHEGVEPPQPSELSGARRPPLVRWVMTAAALVVLICGGGLLAWYQAWTPETSPAATEQATLPMPDKPSIAVLPFTNMSNDPEQDYFSDGLTEDLITDLSKISGLFVVSRNSTFVYKGKTVTPQQIASDLGVRYMLEGSVRRIGDEVRINAQLINTTTGGHVWAERYDGTLDDIFGLQDQLAERITRGLSVTLTPEEESRITNNETHSSPAYEAFLKGWEQFRRQTPDGFAKALGHFERALDIDPDYNQALAALAALYWRTREHEWYPALGLDQRVISQRALDYLEKTQAQPTPLALMVTAEVRMNYGEYGAAIAAAERAVEMAPSDAEAKNTLANVLIYDGQPRRAMDHVEDSMRLDPLNRAHPYYLRGLAEFSLERFEAAAKSLSKALDLNPPFRRPAAILAAAYGFLERKEEAAAALESYSEEYRGYGIPGTVLAFPYRHDVDRSRLAEGLRRAGMPEADFQAAKEQPAA